MDRHDQKKVPNSYQLSSNTANMYKCIYNIVYTHTQTLILLYILSIPWKIMSFINPKTTLFVSQLLGALPSCRTKRRSQGRKLGQIDVGLESLTAWRTCRASAAEFWKSCFITWKSSWIYIVSIEKSVFFLEFRSDQFVASHIMPTSIRRLTTRDSYPCWARRWHNWPKHIYSAWFICRTQLKTTPVILT